MRPLRCAELRYLTDFGEPQAGERIAPVPRTFHRADREPREKLLAEQPVTPRIAHGLLMMGTAIGERTHVGNIAPHAESGLLHEGPLADAFREEQP